MSTVTCKSTSGQPLSGTMKPYPFEASNHLITPLISTRLAALSPRPDSASIAGLPSSENSPGLNPSRPNLLWPSRLDPVTLGDDPPIFLDSNPSDPMTPDPTR